MKKVIPLIILALLVVPASVAFGSSRNASNIVKPSVVLIHGAWADGSSWSRVVSLLQTHGYTVYVPPNPLRGLTSDSAYIASFLQTSRARSSWLDTPTEEQSSPMRPPETRT